MSLFPIQGAFPETPPNKVTYTLLSGNTIIWIPLSAKESKKCFLGGNFAKPTKLASCYMRKK